MDGSVIDDGRFPMSRRALLCGLAAGALMPARALGQQMEWGEHFDATSRAVQMPRSLYPTLSPTTVGVTEQAIAQYTHIVQAGGWPSVPATGLLKIGIQHPNVAALRQRLIVSGDLPPNSGVSDIFDSYVEAGVRRFQSRHGLDADGKVARSTFAALNVPADIRLRQLQVNLNRLHEKAARDLGDRFVMLNIPAADIETVEANQVSTRHTAVVGKIDRQSPILNAKIHEVRFHPYWTVPASIIRKDLIPKMQADPQYLTKNKIRIFDYKGNEFDPSTIDWHSNEATRYMFRQDPSDINSLGSMKINFHNTHQVYMHDTPSRDLFGSDNRFHSSGCARVQNVRELAVWLLKDTPGWDSSVQVDAAIRTPDQVIAKVSRPVPLYWVYVTAWALPDGVVQFRHDIYDKDGLGLLAMAN